MISWPNILEQIRNNTGLTLDASRIHRVSGGSINACYIVSGETRDVFIKTSQKHRQAMFEAEAAGLQAIADTRAISVPRVLCYGSSRDTAYLALQAISLQRAKPYSYKRFGEQLAAMHAYHENQFGAVMDNTIGSTPQHNKWCSDWVEFWRIQRLGFQLELAQKNNAPIRLIDDGLRLLECFDTLLEHRPEASCLHGDLWSGNWGFIDTGEAVIFDPAHYFGDRETDIAMSRLFGPAEADFYAAYQHAFPLQAGYTVRETFYNLYHILNHFNLFGGGYAAQAQQMTENVLSHLR